MRTFHDLEGEMTKQQTRRVDPGARHDANDWLTVFGLLVVFSFHCARHFDHEGWHIKNDVLSNGLSLYVAIVSQWIMPLFFLLSGMSSRFSLVRRSAGSYLWNRTRRLAIPFLFATFVLIVPIQVWIERVTHGEFQGSLLAFYPHYFDGFYAFGGNFAWMGLHLWYLEMLFLFTLLTLPLFLALRGSSRGRAERGTEPGTGHGAGRWTARGRILLWFLPLWAMELLVNLRPEGLGMRAFGGWSPLSYLTIFALGYLLAGDENADGELIRWRRLCLGLLLTLTLLMFVVRPDLSFLGEHVDYALRLLARSANCWFWLAAILGFGARYGARSNAFLRRAREAALPFYILHQSVIVTVAYYLLPWRTTVAAKYLVLASLSLVVILGLYAGIRRARGVRALFGM